jgi:hypothetical protein
MSTKSLKIPKGQSESVNRRKDNTMATKMTTIIRNQDNSPHCQLAPFLLDPLFEITPPLVKRYFQLAPLVKCGRLT